MTTRVYRQSSVEWYTPPDVIRRVRRVLGKIDLDPASCPVANLTVGAKRIYTKEDDGLTKEWRGRVFLNPPFNGTAKPFLRKLLDELRVGNVTDAIAIFQVRIMQMMASRWFWGLQHGCFCNPFERIRFNHPNETSSAPHGGTIIWYSGRHPARFDRAFRTCGLILTANSLIPKMSNDN